MRNRIPTPLLAILCSAVLAAAAWAEPRTYTVYRAQTPPKIDGRLDDECWRAVPWQTGFTLLGGGEVGEPSQTQFAMVWDDASLYLAVRCTDSAMDRLVAKADDGSKDLLHDDHVEIFLAPEKQRDDYAQFAVNSLNKKIDLSYQAKKETATQAISKGSMWISACRRGKSSWELEMALPLAALKLDPHEGVVFLGNIGRVRWADPPANRPITPGRRRRTLSTTTPPRSASSSWRARRRRRRARIRSPSRTGATRCRLSRAIASPARCSASARTAGCTSTGPSSAAT